MRQTPRYFNVLPHPLPGNSHRARYRDTRPKKRETPSRPRDGCNSSRKIYQPLLPACFAPPWNKEASDQPFPSIRFLPRSLSRDDVTRVSEREITIFAYIERLACAASSARSSASGRRRAYIDINVALFPSPLGGLILIVAGRTWPCFTGRIYPGRSVPPENIHPCCPFEEDASCAPMFNVPENSSRRFPEGGWEKGLPRPRFETRFKKSPVKR